MQESPSQMPRDIDSIFPNEWKKYCAVLGWRIWALTENSALYPEAMALADSKPLTLKSRVTDQGRGFKLYDLLLTRYRPAYQDIFGRESIKMPDFFLEPLSEDEVRRIDEERQVPGPHETTDHPHELLRPEDLIKVFTDERVSPV